MIRKKGQFVRIDTPHTTLVLDPERGEAVYYGEKLGAACEFAAFAGAGRRIFTVFGRAGGTEHSVALYNADGGTTADFRLSRSRILAEKPALPDLPSSYGEGKTLELRYTDAPTKVALLLYFTAFEDSDVIAVSAQLCNGSKKPVRLRRLMSLQIDLPGAGYRVHTFEGGWARERHEEVRRLDSGVFVNQWTTGYSSHARNPFVAPAARRETKPPRRRLLFHQLQKEVPHQTLCRFGRTVPQRNDHGEPLQHRFGVRRVQEGRGETAEGVLPGDVVRQRMSDEMTRRVAAVGQAE